MTPAERWVRQRHEIERVEYELRRAEIITWIYIMLICVGLVLYGWEC